MDLSSPSYCNQCHDHQTNQLKRLRYRLILMCGSDYQTWSGLYKQDHLQEIQTGLERPGKSYEDIGRKKIRGISRPNCPPQLDSRAEPPIRRNRPICLCSRSQPPSGSAYVYKTISVNGRSCSGSNYNGEQIRFLLPVGVLVRDSKDDLRTNMRLTCADGCPPCAWPVFYLVVGCYREDVSRLLLWRPRRFCAICKRVVTLSPTGVSLVCGKSVGIVRVGFTRHPSKKQMPGSDMIPILGQNTNKLIITCFVRARWQAYVCRVRGAIGCIFFSLRFGRCRTKTRSWQKYKYEKQFCTRTRLVREKREIKT